MYEKGKNILKCFQNNLRESSDRGRESGADRISGSRVEREGGSIDIFFHFRRLHAACEPGGSNGIYQRGTSGKNQNIPGRPGSGMKNAGG